MMMLNLLLLSLCVTSFSVAHRGDHHEGRRHNRGHLMGRAVFKPWIGKARDEQVGETAEVSVSGRDRWEHMRQAKIERLTARLEKIDDVLKEVESDRWSSKKEHLETKLTRINNNRCGRFQFQCGTDKSECISKTLVCDGSVDCSNGFDERDELCDNKFQEGSSWSSSAVWTSCLDIQSPIPNILVRTAIRSKRLPGRINLSLTLSTNDADNDNDDDNDADGTDTDGDDDKTTEDADTVSAMGMWNVNARKFVVFPDEGRQLGYICKFAESDDRRCVGYVIRIPSLEKCAELVVTRNDN